MKALADSKRAVVRELLKKGCTVRETSAQTGVSLGTISGIRQALVEGGDTGRLNGDTGRPRIMNKRQERNAVRLVVSGKCQTATVLKKTLEDEYGLDVSTSTCKRVLHRAGLRGRVKIKKPLLRKTHRKKRMAFARRLRDWKVDEFKRIIFSDESKFNVFGSDGRQYCWRREGEALRDQHVQPTIKHGGGNIMIWSCITWDGVGYMCAIEEKMNAKVYQDILESQLLDTLEFYRYEKGDFIFQHDNDPKHTATSTKKWLADNEISVLEWPPQSADLNPIEHMWNELDRRIRKRHKLPTSKDDLWEAIKEEWEAIPLEFVRKLFETMPERVKDVRKAKGGYTPW
jgi:transposase